MLKISRGVRVILFSATLAVGLLATAQAQNEPEEKFYSEPITVSATFTRVRIGYRKSTREGERSAFKWLSRLIKEVPKETNYMVEWQTYRNGRKISVSMSYNSAMSQLTRFQWLSNKPIKTDIGQTAPFYQEVWNPVSIREIHSVARKNGTVSSLEILKL